MLPPLPKPAVYTPFDKGLYQVAPLLRPFGSTFGNDPVVEVQIFQLDEDFPKYRRSKIEALRERKDKYLCQSRFSAEAQKRIVLFIIERLHQEHPYYFQLQKSESLWTLYCALTGTELKFSLEGVLKSSSCSSSKSLIETNLQYQAHEALEALSLEIQEDFSVWTYEGEEDWMAYASICFPNHWAPEDKIGRNFFQVHEPVAGAGPMLKSSKKLVESMVLKGPFVRFAWGIATDKRLNHHPQAPTSWDPALWKGRAFDPQNPQIWVRTERQTLHGFPEDRLSLFTIRTYFQDVSEIKAHPELREKLVAALRSMSPESLHYKGLSESLDSILNWLDAKSP
jgi:hypothetical protein